MNEHSVRSSAIVQALAVALRDTCDSPDDVQAQCRLAQCHKSFGILLEEAGRIDECLSQFDAAAKIIRRLMANKPSDLGLKKDLLNVLARARVVLYGEYKVRELLRNLDASVTVLEEAVNYRPQDLQWSLDLANLHFLRAHVAGSLGNVTAMLHSYELAARRMKELAALDSRNESFQQWHRKFREHYEIARALPVWLVILLSLNGRLFYLIMARTTRWHTRRPNPYLCLLIDESRLKSIPPVTDA